MVWVAGNIGYVVWSLQSVEIRLVQGPYIDYKMKKKRTKFSIGKYKEKKIGIGKYKEKFQYR